MEINWYNPYAQRRGSWLKGNLHTHTREHSGCANIPLGESLACYRKAGDDFLAVSDHMFVHEPPPGSLPLIPGVEWNSSRGEHAGVYLANRFAVKRAGRWRISLGHDGGAQVYVDGRSVLCQPVRVNPASPGRSCADLSLRKGTHDIVIAFDTDHGLGWGIFFKFEVPPRAQPHAKTPSFPAIVRLPR